MKRINLDKPIGLGHTIGTSRLVQSCLLSIIFLLAVGIVQIDARTAASPNVGQETLDALIHTNFPSRDRIDLARRYQGVTGSFTPLSQPLHMYQVGDTAPFWITDESHNRTFQITAQLLYATPHLYMWFEDGSQPDLAAVKKAADEFESRIYPLDHRYFGSEQSPGVDGDVHLFILHAHHLGDGVGGYFSSADTYPSTIVQYSNQHNMFFINLDSQAESAIGSTWYEGTLAHEFQHMIHHAVQPAQAAWLNEGLSEAARLLTGYAYVTSAPVFMSHPDTQLNAWEDGGSLLAQHYGAGYLFAAYFAQRFGADQLPLIEADPGKGLADFDDVLPGMKPSTTTTDFFADWQAANLIQDSNVGDGRYGYSQLLETLPLPTSQPLMTGTHSVTTRQYGTQYLTLTTPGSYTFRFAGQPTAAVIPTNAHGGSHFWWAGREDESDARLTHDFDLRRVRSATLSFWAWYAIEPDWDYGYVSVSTDGGLTWHALQGIHTSTANPYGNSYGPGFTGISNPASHTDDDLSVAPQWIQENIDLAPYVGQAIKLRLEYVTDDELTLAGFAVDDIQIPEIGYQADAETSDDGWQSEGWTRIDNILPQSYLIQAITFHTDGSVDVSRLTYPAQTSWPITVGGNISKVVIAVAGLTRFTYEPAPFIYTLTQS